MMFGLQFFDMCSFKGISRKREREKEKTEWPDVVVVLDFCIDASAAGWIIATLL